MTELELAVRQYYLALRAQEHIGPPSHIDPIQTEIALALHKRCLALGARLMGTAVPEMPASPLEAAVAASRAARGDEIGLRYQAMLDALAKDYEEHRDLYKSIHHE